MVERNCDLASVLNDEAGTGQSWIRCLQEGQRGELGRHKFKKQIKRAAPFGARMTGALRSALEFQNLLPSVF